MLAMGNPTVDYFSLDIEGAEVPVLKTIPWKKVDFKIIGIEMNHLGQIFEGSPKTVQNLLNENGYFKRAKANIDDFFVNEKYFKPDKKKGKKKKKK